MERVRRVVIAFSPHVPWFRETLRGVRRFADEHGGWDLAFALYGPKLRDLIGDPPLLGGIDGVISEQQVDFDALGVPPRVVVALGPYGPDAGQPIVCSDMTAVGRMAAEYLMKRGLRRFVAFSAPWEKHLSAGRRARAFVQHVRDAGLYATIFATGERTRRRGTFSFEDQMLDLIDLLADIPKPLGLFAVDVDHAWRALLACKRGEGQGFRVPDDVAIVGGGEDADLFDSVHPSLSGVLYDNVRVGYEAAATLERLMQGERAAPLREIPPLSVVVRASSDALAIEDPEVKGAVRYIWDHVDKALRVEDVLDALPVAGRTLSRKFRQTLGHTPADEIRRSRIETAKRLLMSSDLPLARVALASGYGQQAQLNRYIKQDTGLTPGQFRERHRMRG